MELTPELIDEIVLAAKEVDYGSVIISISGKPDNKIVDISTDKRRRFKKNAREGSRYELDML